MISLDRVFTRPTSLGVEGGWCSREGCNIPVVLEPK